ncbi:MAG: hypothetical protein ACI88A_001485 [Paraglaciecola sp.]
MKQNLPSTLDWRLILATTITLFWLGFGIFYLGAYIGWSKFFEQPLDSLGSFLEGAFAPLAFLWLVIGYFLQQKELSENTKAIKKQYIEMQKSSEHAAIQAASIQISVLHSQQQSFIRIYEMVRVSLGSIVGMLYISSQGQRGAALIDADEVSRLWSEMMNGDVEIFARRFLILNALGEQDMYELLCGTEIRTRHNDNFIRQFGRLIENATACDPDGMLVDAICNSAHGRLYEIMLLHRETAQKNESGPSGN